MSSSEAKAYESEKEEHSSSSTASSELHAEESTEESNDGVETVTPEQLEAFEGGLTALTSASIVVVFALFFCMGFMLGQSIMERLKL